MAMHVPRAPGFAQMLKDGAKHFSGLDEAVYRNIDACKELAKTTRSAFGPHGQNKMVINHIEKLFVTNDAATILSELEVQHPAAKMLVLATQQQEQEVGDGTNFVMIFAGALLEQAEMLLRMGLSVTEVTEGFELASKKALDILPDLVCEQKKDLRNREEVARAIRTSVMSKQYGNEDFLAKLIGGACGKYYSLHKDRLALLSKGQKSNSDVSIMTEKLTFNVDHIRVNKILGCGVLQSSAVQGMVFRRQVEGEINKASKCKIAVYSCPLDAMQTETKGTVLLKNAEELMNFSQGEENLIEQQVKSIAETGCTVIVSGGKVGEMAQHFCNKYRILVVRLMSKWDLRRLCKAVGATPLPRITPPTAEEAGYCDNVFVDEIGDTPVIIFKQDKEESAITTIVVRGSTDNIMDDIERAINDGVNTYKALTRDNRVLPGAGATEIELSKQITTIGEGTAGLEQYAIKKFAEALEVVPRTIAENAGQKATEVLSLLYAAHQEGKKNVGVDIEAQGAGTLDAAEKGLFDLYLAKYWGIRFATVAACTVLKVDQIIMAKAAGGPKPRDAARDDDD